MRLRFFCVMVLLQISLLAQNKTIPISEPKIPLDSLLIKVENLFDVRFSYQSNLIIGKTVSIDIEQLSLFTVLELLEEKHNLSFDFISERNIVIKRKNNYIPLNKKQLLGEIILDSYLTKGVQKQKDGSFKILPKKLDILPGITEPDVFQSIQLLPGIANLDETSTNIFVRGGTPDQNLILWDNIKIYHPGHLFGTFSVFNPYITENIKFINKGTEAKYGNRVSSIIDIKSNDKIAAKFKGGFGFNLIEFDGYVETPMIDDKLSILISGRRSFTDFLTSNTYLKFAEKVFQNQNVNPIFKGENKFYFLDYSVKLNWKISDNNYLNFSFINIENKLETLYDKQNSLSVYDLLETENEGYSLNWSKKWYNKWSHEINTYFSNYILSFSQTDELNTPPASVENSNEVFDIGLNINFDYTINKNQILNFGYQFSNYNIDYLISDTNNTLKNKSSLNSYSLYSSYLYKNNSLFDINIGSRVSYYSAVNSIVFEPRINIFKKLNSNFSIQATVERKTQVISQITETINQRLTLENQIWTIANGDNIPVVSSWQYTGGVIYSRNNWNIEFDAYYKKIEGLTTLNRGFIDIENYSFSKGESVVKGIDFYIRKQFNYYKTFASYTIGSVKNNFDGINEDERFPSNTDITNNFNWSHEFSYKRFRFSLGWLWRTGKPYSKAIGFADDDNQLIEYDGINAYRLPNYHRLDFSSTYNFKISKNKNINGKIGLSILNILNKENILNRTYFIDSTTKTINSVDTKSLTRVPNLVFRVNW